MHLKIEYMVIGRDQIINIFANEAQLKQVDQFKYIGSNYQAMTGKTGKLICVASGVLRSLNILVKES